MKYQCTIKVENIIMHSGIMMHLGIMILKILLNKQNDNITKTITST